MGRPRHGEVKCYVIGDKYGNSKGKSKARGANYSDSGHLGSYVATPGGQLPFFTNVGQRPQPHFKDGDPEVKSQ